MIKLDKNQIYSQYKKGDVTYIIFKKNPISFPDGSQTFINNEQQLEFKPKITCCATQKIEDIK